MALISQETMKKRAASFISKNFASGQEAADVLECTRANISLFVSQVRPPSKKLLNLMGYKKVAVYERVDKTESK